MRSGELRHRIIIEKKTVSVSTQYGERTVSWSSNIGAYCAIYPMRGNLYFASQQTQAGATHRIRMRYATLAASTEIAPGYCRVKYGDRYFTIHNVVNVDERNIMLELYCSEEVGG